MKNNNKGFTLVELIVVIAIIGVVASMTSLSFSTVSSKRAERCATSVDSLISRCRLGCISHSGNTYLIITLDSDKNIVGEYYENGVKVSTDTFPGKGTTVTYTTTAGTVSLASKPLTLSFNRATGAQNFQTDGVSYCTAITFTSGKVYTITLVPSTGNHKFV